MTRYFILAGLAIISISGACSSTLDLTEFKQANTEKPNTEILLENVGFEEGGKAWNMQNDRNVQVERSVGMNGGTGLKYMRNDTRYTLVTQEIKRPVPGKKYKFGAMVKGHHGTICLEVMKGNKYLYGIYGSEYSKNDEWIHAKNTFITRGEDPNECRYFITLYILPGYYGTAYFDDVYMLEDKPEWLFCQIYPTHQSISESGGKIKFSSVFIGEYVNQLNVSIKDLRILLEVVQNNEAISKVLCQVRDNNLVEADFGKLPEGEVILKATLLNLAKKEILGVKELPLNIMPTKTPPLNSCVIDENGRAIFNGKKFMPLGLYGHTFSENDLKIIHDSKAFNCVMPYFLHRDASSLNAVESFMTQCSSLNIYIIFNIIGVPKEIVSRFKTHPALLAWYIADEQPVDMLPKQIEKRRLVNKLDRWHPTWAVFYQTQNFVYYFPGLDVFGYDPYPIRKSESTLAAIDYVSQTVEQLHVANWAVPQIFNWGNYDDKAKNNLDLYNKEFRYPTEHEMLAIPVLEAINGAKGFVMYSYFDLKNGPDKNQFEKRWPEVCRVAQKLKSLENFILSDKEGPALSIKNNTGKVKARCYTDDKNNYRILIAGIHKDSDAIIQAPSYLDKLKSSTGLTKNIGGGKYLFKGSNICCDILE